MDNGLLRVGDNADFIVTNNQKIEEIIDVYIKGKSVVKKGKAHIKTQKATIINNFNAKPITSEYIKVFAKTSTVKVIEAIDGSLITKKQIQTLPQKDNILLANVSHDISKIVVINRYEPSTPTVGFITGFD